MATAVTEPAAGANRERPHHHLLAVATQPDQLPFPTTPSLPDRRSRLKRLNLNMASRESAGSESSADFNQSKRMSRERLDGSVSPDSRALSISETAHDDSSISAERRTRRNIIMSRQYRRYGDSISLGTRHPGSSRRRRDRSKQEHEEAVRLRLPSIGINQRVASPQQGVFLTALAGYDESPMPSDRTHSSSPKLSQDDNDSTTTSNNTTSPTAATATTTTTITTATTTTIAPTRQNGEVSSHHREHLPVLATPRDNAAASRTALTSWNTVGLQRVYLEGLDYMRSHVTSVEQSVDEINRSFHKVQTNSGEDFDYYLRECDERLLQANTDLRKRDVKLEVIDSDSRLVRLLNELRLSKPPDMDLITFITNFWEELKATADKLQALLDRFDKSVLKRLSDNYISSHSADLQIPVCQQYALDIEDFLKDLDTQLANANVLVRSCGNRLQVDLIDTSAFTEKLLLTCDVKAFPILGFVHDVCGKISKMCESARLWLARDEQFMHEINAFIRETRGMARRREMVLMSEKQKHKKTEKSVRIAHSILHNNKEKLRQIESELQSLEAHMSESKEAIKSKAEEIQQKETMVDFLKLTLQQTKKNYSLQTKRTKLLRQVKDLEDYLHHVENDIETVQDQILAKSHEKILLREKIQTSEKSYGVLKTDFERLSEGLEKLEADVSGLSGQLLQLEIVNTIRTSPETLDNLIDRPSTVKLSQSLKERIKERKKKAAAAAKGSS